ncbi:MAG: type II toxin-antitoxin system RelE/ParE family toxin [Chloroflexi bacterium]|nr:type II toxin-antitoxin system RelE/ParE family toxin [Chloroflexota bacterium]
MSYKVFVSRRAQGELGDLPSSVLRRVDKVLQALALEPRPRGALQLKGKASEGWRLRVSDYRILYTIDDNAKLIRVYRIKHRREVYRG